MKTEFPRTREGKIARYAQSCVHFNGVQHGACKAGVSYETIPRNISSFVCFGECDGCEKYQARGEQAARDEFATMDKYAEKVGLCMKAIIDKHGKQRGLVDSMQCPACKTGTLRYSIAGYNGHIHGQCSTEGCAAWMQ